MGGCHRHLIDEDEDEEEDEEEEEDDIYMYPTYMTLDDRAEFRAACRVLKASEWNRQ